MGKNNTTLAIILAITVIVLGGFLYIEKTKPLPIDYDAQVATLEVKIDSLTFRSDSLSFKNDSIQKENSYLAFSKDSLKTVIGSKEVKIKEHKELRNENSRIVYSASDSSIVRVLTEYEFKAASKRLALLVLNKGVNDSIVSTQEQLILDYKKLSINDSIVISNQTSIIANQDAIIANYKTSIELTGDISENEKEAFKTKHLKQKKKFIVIVAILVGLIIIK